ncbi:hypothetical protein ACGFK1_22440 [Mycobacterium sp. NPDC048908]|uniref:hypothetical protein n=1 Tax=Mycobacterium sp. NPDC048908 TaxID=3364292 RepID=UPI00371C141D
MRLVKDSWRFPAGCVALLALACACGTDNSTTLSTTSARTTVAAAITSAPEPSAQPSQRTAKWIDLDVGDCLADPPPSDPGVVTVSVIDCALPHAAEVYLRTDVEVNAAIADVADQRCRAGLMQYTGQQPGPLAMTYLIDSNQDRTSDDPMPSTVICLLQAAAGGPLTGSARR